ncbi:hypothetical protein [Frigoribacterium sp. PhB160]|uniref:hypothetical protein n=1 Tax=Frigoribacterium sp. PhB160 TaxID=2485192 RepID=UPI000F464AD0|nr:hypothetical protein [Frigoribacterium sp. PhB160]
MSLEVEIMQHTNSGVPVWYLHWSYPAHLPGEPARGPYPSQAAAQEALARLKECAQSYGEYEFSSVHRA